MDNIQESSSIKTEDSAKGNPYKTRRELSDINEFRDLSEEEVATLSKNLKELRIKKQLSLASIAKRLNLTTQGYSDIEHGKRKKRLAEKIFKLAEIFEIMPESLVGRTPPNTENVNVLSVPAFFYPDPDELLPELRRKNMEAYNALLKCLSTKGEEGKKYDTFCSVIIAVAKYAEA